MRCPECRAVIGGENIRYPHFECPNCGCDLCVPTTFRLKAHLLGAVIGFGGCYLLGLRDLLLFLCGIPSSILVGIVLVVIGTVVVPLTLERYFSGSLRLK